MALHDSIRLKESFQMCLELEKGQNQCGICAINQDPSNDEILLHFQCILNYKSLATNRRMIVSITSISQSSHEVPVSKNSYTGMNTPINHLNRHISHWMLYSSDRFQFTNICDSQRYLTKGCFLEFVHVKYFSWYTVMETAFSMIFDSIDLPLYLSGGYDTLVSERAWPF